MVTTAGAAAPTTSAYESRPPAMACVIGVPIVVGLAVLCASRLCHAAPVTSIPAARTASAAREALCVMFDCSFMSSVLSMARDPV
jgi:hypothetical protein